MKSSISVVQCYMLVLFGGTAPVVATWLIQVTGSRLAPAVYLTVVAIGALGAMLCARDNAGKDMNDISG